MKTMVSTAGAAPGPIEVGDALDPGAKAGPWVVERELGRGGMGAVYAVVHDEIGKRAALKVVHAKIMTPGFNADRMLLEAKVVNQVGHPNIVDIFETGRLPDSRPYIVMERLEGQPLSYRADDGKILPDQVIGILLQVCDALIAAHAAGVIHRDLKLDNVFLVDNPDDPSSPRVKLLDWGIAKVLHHDVRHTIEGQLVGTPQYLAPEQARGAAVSPATDVYSLGVMAYELFLEQLPFEAETSAEIMAMHLRAAPPPPRDLWPDIPEELESLILSMLAKNPDHRPSMLEVARKLEEVREALHRRCDEKRASAELQVPRTPSIIVSPKLFAPDSKPLAPIAVAKPDSSARLPRARSEDDAGLLPTLAAEEVHGPRRWQWAVGAVAIVASAAMFLFTRGGDSAAAAAIGGTDIREVRGDTWKLDDRAQRRAETPVVAPATPDPAPIIEAEAALAELDATLESLPAAEESAPAVKPPAKKPPRTTRATIRHGSSSMAYRSSTRQAPVAPRRATKIDPDGTIDPYR